MLAKLELRDRRALAAWRPEGRRRRLGAMFALPLAVWSVGRPLAWVGVGAAALAGVVVVVVALVALEVIVERDPAPPAAVASPPGTPEPTSTSSPPVVSATAPTPTPTVTPSPAPAALPTPAPSRIRTPASRPPGCEGFGCFEPAPGAVEYTTWRPGEAIDWPEGAFVLETATGRVLGYRVEPQYTNTGWHEAVDYRVLARSWVGARITEMQRTNTPPAYARRSYLLLDRESLRSWRWPADELDLEAVSDDHILLRDVSAGRYTLMTREGDVRTQFALPGAAGEYFDYSDSLPTHRNSFFSPDGQVVVIGVDAAVYWMPVSASRPEVLFEAEQREGWVVSGVQAAYTGTPPWWGVRHDVPRSIRVVASYARVVGTDSEDTPLTHDTEIHFFTWDGESLPSPPVPTCPGHASPDGRYVAQQRGFALGHKYHGHIPEGTGPWPLVVIVDGESCEPVLRVLSAYTYQGLWQAEWLSNSTGYVVGLADGHAAARVDPDRTLTSLPVVPAISGRVPGPVPGPSGDGRYFSYEFAGVYDAVRDEWKQIDFFAPWPDSEVYWDLTSWGATHEEIHYQTGRWGPLSSWDGAFGGSVTWFLLQPKVEFPPFEDELSFLVARTGGCLDLRESLEVGEAIVACLPDGARVSLVPSPDYPDHPHFHLRQAALPSGDRWAYIRSEDGIEGWASIDYLRHE